PGGDALAGAGRHRSALGVVVEGVEGHSLRIDEDVAERGFGAHGGVGGKSGAHGGAGDEKGGREAEHHTFHRWTSSVSGSLGRPAGRQLHPSKTPQFRFYSVSRPVTFA